MAPRARGRRFTPCCSERPRHRSGCGTDGPEPMPATSTRFTRRFTPRTTYGGCSCARCAARRRRRPETARRGRRATRAGRSTRPSRFGRIHRRASGPRTGSWNPPPSGLRLLGPFGRRKVFPRKPGRPGNFFEKGPLTLGQIGGGRGAPNLWAFFFFPLCVGGGSPPKGVWGPPPPCSFGGRASLLRKGGLW